MLLSRVDAAAQYVGAHDSFSGDSEGCGTFAIANYNVGSVLSMLKAVGLKEA